MNKVKSKIFLLYFISLFIVGLLLIQSVKTESITGTNYSINQPTGTFSIIGLNWSKGTFAMDNAVENTDNYAQALLAIPDNATSLSDTSIILTLEENITANTNASWTSADLFNYTTIYGNSISLSYNDIRYNNTPFDNPTNNVTIDANGKIIVNLSNCLSANETIILRFVYNITVTMLGSPSISIYYTNTTQSTGIQFPTVEVSSTIDCIVGYNISFQCQMPNSNSLSTYDVNATIYWIPPDKTKLDSQDIYLDGINQTGVTWSNSEAEYDIENFVSNTTQILFNTTWNLGYDIDHYDGYGGDNRKVRQQYQYWNTSTSNPVELYLNVSWFQDGYDKIDTDHYSSTYNRFKAEQYRTHYHRVLAWIHGNESESIEIVYWKNYADWEDTQFPAFNITVAIIIVIAICSGILAISIYYYFKS
ncbi:MAG: hypothetical protein DRP74_06755 [Candidatus Omnitrophota bacterium]|nr:MAG: hypothetical protein DRP74_06755 [Candidatus Omnitrophota bacterium]